MQKIFAAAVGAALVGASIGASALTQYTYATSPTNPPAIPGVPEFTNPFTLKFITDDALEANSFYEISVALTAPDTVLWWEAAAENGPYLVDSGATIVKVATGSMLEGGALLQCGGTGERRCFGGGIATDSQGAIVSWNLVANSRANETFKTFITYNSALGETDAVVGNRGYYGSSSGDTGSWTSQEVAAIPVPEPETYALMLAGLGLVAVAARRRRK